MNMIWNNGTENHIENTWKSLYVKHIYKGNYFVNHIKQLKYLRLLFKYTEITLKKCLNRTEKFSTLGLLISV